MESQSHVLNPPKPYIVPTLFLALVSGLVIGAAAAALSYLLYLILLFPVLMAGAGIFVLEKNIIKNKIHGYPRGIVLGLIMGVAILGSFHYVDYLIFRIQTVQAINQNLIEEYGTSNPTVASRLFDVGLLDETGYKNFPGYLLYEFKSDMPIAEFGIFSVGSVPAWADWLLEFCAIFFILVGDSATTSGKPFCEIHNRWYEGARHRGGVPASYAGKLLGLINQNDFLGLGQLLQEDPASPSVEIYVQSCSHCQYSKSLLSVMGCSSGPNGRVTLQPILKLSITPAQNSDLTRGLERKIITPGGEGTKPT